MTMRIGGTLTAQAADKARTAADEAIRQGAAKVRSMSSAQLASFLSEVPARDRGFVERTVGAFKRMSAAQVDQVVAYMGTAQKQRLSAAFAAIKEGTEKNTTPSTTAGSSSRVEPAVVIRKASESFLGGLVYGRLRT
jgi:hypothetical protein